MTPGNTESPLPRGPHARLSPAGSDVGRGISIPRATRSCPDAAEIGLRLECVAASGARTPVTGRKDGPIQRAGTWQKLRATSARHWPMTHGRDRGAADRAANSARHGGDCSLPAHHYSLTPRASIRCSLNTSSATLRRAHASIRFSSMPGSLIFLPRAETFTEVHSK